MPKPTTNQIRNKSTLSGVSLTDVLNNIVVSGGGGSGDMLKAVYDPDNDGKVSSAVVADSIEWSGVQNKPGTFTPSAHTHSKAEIGLGNVDDTSDADKPLSSLAVSALAGKQPTLVSGSNIKTINGINLLGPGNVIISGGGGGGGALGQLAWLPIQINDDTVVPSGQGAFGYATSIATGKTVTVGSGSTLTLYDKDKAPVADIVAGTGINVLRNGQTVTVYATSSLSTYVNIGTGYGLYSTTVGSQVQFKTLIPGSGITISSGLDSITINNSQTPGEINTAVGVGSGTNLVAGKSAAALQFKGLAAGTGMLISTTSDTVTLKTVTLSPSDPGAIGAGCIWVTP